MDQANAYEPTTIKRVKKQLRNLTANCNTSNPEELKTYIANKQCSNAYTELLSACNSQKMTLLTLNLHSAFITFFCSINDLKCKHAPNDTP